LTGERKRLVEEIFLGAADLPSDQRADYLRLTCPDPEIAAEVNSLLIYDAAAASSLDNVVQEAAASLVGADPLIGARLGPYRITEEVGKGGMGTVFLASRDDQTFEKKVAVKVVKRGMDSAGVLDRFRHERRILANLDHPYICRLFDAGTTPDGRPYFVMEYVEGKPIVAYCRAHKLELPAVLDLFRKVCDAVSCAHRNLVVHRDLKASNILVATDGSPRLLDFGIAKLLDPQSRTEDTAPAGRMCTLDCASPEQIRGESVTTSTDIYSLGILLFELIAGKAPWDFHSMHLMEAEHAICNSPAPKPSAVLRQTDPSSPWRALTGDLDNIVLMALRKDPAHRYRSVDEFSMELFRYQNGLPVIAREDSLFYNGVKFLGRHWVVVALSTLAILGLVGGVIYANMERRRAEVRLTQMLSMANQTLLDLHTQIEHQPGATETRLRIMQSTLTYLANLAKEAGNNQEVRDTLGTAYLHTGDVQGYPHAPNLGDTSGALASYAEAEKLFSPDDHVHLATLLSHRGDVLCQLARTQECVAVLKSSLKQAAQSDKREALLSAAETYHHLAFVETQFNTDQALEDSRHEMEIYTRLVEREPDNAEVLTGLASSYSTMGGALNRRFRFSESLALYRKGLAIREKIVAKSPNDVALRRDLMISYGRVGDVLGNPSRSNLGDRAGALALFQKARAIAESLAAADPKNRLAQMDLAQIWTRTGITMDEPGGQKEALSLLDGARSIVVSLQAGREPVSEQLRLLAWIDEARGRHFAALNDSSAALLAYRVSYDEGQSSLRKDPNDASARMQVLWTCRGLAAQLASIGHRDDALRTAREAIAAASQNSPKGPDPMTMALFLPRTNAWLGTVYELLAHQDSTPVQRKADFASAAESYARASDLWQHYSLGKDFPPLQAEISDSAKKAVECSRRAKIG
jgi:serine/threonine protein kinase/tetratricopeptide (TPR) repeat protein